jgi:hypothetical protein
MWFLQRNSTEVYFRLRTPINGVDWFLSSELPDPLAGPVNLLRVAQHREDPVRLPHALESPLPVPQPRFALGHVEAARGRAGLTDVLGAEVDVARLAIGRNWFLATYTRWCILV